MAETSAGGLGRLRGKNVTGAAKGTGRATAELFAHEGANLVVTNVDEEGLLGLSAELEDAGTPVAAVVGDVSDPGDARDMIRAAVDRFGV